MYVSVRDVFLMHKYILYNKSYLQVFRINSIDFQYPKNSATVTGKHDQELDDNDNNFSRRH